VIDHGRKIAEGTSRELKAAVGAGMLQVTLADAAQAEAAARLLEARLQAAAQRGVEGARLSVMTGSPEDASAAVAALLAAGVGLTDFAMGSPTLDEVFFALTGREREETAEAEE
jgi:ABC-2 type transport system ATP-binding protein